ncbi:MAG: FHA domain-containing protein [Planctomycetota bacterium]|nr:MAG: FHA domain-containing protein [Planctomycetota bacterium]
MSTSYKCPRCQAPLLTPHQECPRCSGSSLNIGKTTRLYSAHKPRNITDSQFAFDSSLQQKFAPKNLTSPMLNIFRNNQFIKKIELGNFSQKIIGRSPEVDITLSLETVSKRHSMLFYKDGQIYIKDLGSRNGTSVNAQRLSEGEERALNSGDIIRISQFYLSIHFPPPPSPQANQTQAPSITIAELNSPQYAHLSPKQKEAILRLHNMNLPNPVDGEINTLVALEKADAKLKSKFQEAGRTIRQMLKPIPEAEGNARFAMIFKPLLLEEEGVGGDFYSVLKIQPNKIAIALGDVAGHGLSASYIMPICLTTIKMTSKLVSSPAELLENVNEQVGASTERGKFVTVFFGILDVENGHFEYSSAGHPPPIVFNRRKKISPWLLEGKGPGCGILRGNARYQNYSVQLEPGDRLIFYTDGVIEAAKKVNLNQQKDFVLSVQKILEKYNGKNFDEIVFEIGEKLDEIQAAEEEYGEERLKEALRLSSNLPLKESLNKIMADIQNFMERHNLQDDITLIGVDWH